MDQGQERSEEMDQESKSLIAVVTAVKAGKNKNNKL